MLPSFEDYSCFVVCGKTDMRCGIHSLAHKVQDDLGKDLFNRSMFIFCGGSGYRTLKILTWEPTGFYLITKQVIPSSRGFCWPKNRTDAEQITQDDLGRLLIGQDIWRALNEVKGTPIL
jgi:transposase